MNLPVGIQRWTNSQSFDQQGALAKWRERILYAVLATALTLSLAAFIPAILVGVHQKLKGLLIIDVAVYMATWCLFRFRRLNYEFRAAAAVALVYMVGLNVCIEVGFFSGGPIYLFTCSILAGLLIGLRAAVLAVVLNAATITILGCLMGGGALPAALPYFPSLERALAAGASYVLLNAVSAISTAVLVGGLHQVTTRQKELTEELSREKAELIVTRRRLRAENKERQRSEKALRQSEAQYRLLAENIRDVIFSLDMEMNYTYVSPAVEALQGWRPEEMIGANVASVLPPKSMQLAAETLLSQLSLSETTGDYNRSVVLELELLHKDGSTVWSEITAGFLMGDDEKPVGILGVSRNISERLRAQQEKEALQEQLVRSKKMEALGLLAGGVAHDLNNVLSGIVSYPDLLLLDMAPTNPLYKPINIIRQSGQKAGAIVQDLLTLARRGVVTAEVLNLNTLVHEYIQSPEFKSLLSFHQAVEVCTRLEQELPNIAGSAVHLKKTLMNLVSNAAEAQPRGGVITITSRSIYLDRPIKGYDQVAEGDYVLLAVADQGEGIAAADLPRIFEPFYTKKIMGRSGTGLGMAVVWGSVQDHNGYIDVQSAPGEGTTFTLYFPMTRQALPDHDTPPALVSYMGQGETVLVVDDIDEQRQIAVNLLDRLNYQAIAVSSGEEAVAYIQSHPMDLIILDMIMDPGMDGLDTYRAVVACRPGQKAVIASGYAETDRVREAQRLGAGPYVKKPYTIQKIGQAVRQALHTGRAD